MEGRESRDGKKWHQSRPNGVSVGHHRQAKRCREAEEMASAMTSTPLPKIHQSCAARKQGQARAHRSAPLPAPPARPVSASAASHPLSGENGQQTRHGAAARAVSGARVEWLASVFHTLRRSQWALRGKDVEAVQPPRERETEGEREGQEENPYQKVHLRRSPGPVLAVGEISNGSMDRQSHASQAGGE